MYIHTVTYIHICIYICRHYAFTRTWIYAYIYIYTHYIHTYIHTYIPADETSIQIHYTTLWQIFKPKIHVELPGPTHGPCRSRPTSRHGLRVWGLGALMIIKGSFHGSCGPIRVELQGLVPGVSGCVHGLNKSFEVSWKMLNIATSRKPHENRTEPRIKL